MVDGDKLALAAVAGLAFISSLSRKRRGAKNETAPFDPDNGFPLIHQVSEDKTQYKMGQPQNYDLGLPAHVIDEEAMQRFEAEGGASEDVYNTLEHENYAYLPAPGVDVRSLLEEPGAVSPRVRKELEVQEIVLPKGYPSTRAGAVVDVIFFSSPSLCAAIFLDDHFVHFGKSTRWFNQILDYLDSTEGPKAVIDVFTTMHRLLKRGVDLTWPDDSETSANLRKAVDLFESNEGMLTTAVLSILLGEGELDRGDLNQAQVLSLLQGVGKDGLIKVRQAFPHGFEGGASALGRSTVTLGGVRLPFALTQSSHQGSS
jgi:hypothetical protein